MVPHGNHYQSKIRNYLFYALTSLGGCLRYMDSSSDCFVLHFFLKLLPATSIFSKYSGQDSLSEMSSRNISGWCAMANGTSMLENLCGVRTFLTCYALLISPTPVLVCWKNPRGGPKMQRCSASRLLHIWLCAETRVLPSCQLGKVSAKLGALSSDNYLNPNPHWPLTPYTTTLFPAFVVSPCPAFNISCPYIIVLSPWYVKHCASDQNLPNFGHFLRPISLMAK